MQQSKTPYTIGLHLSPGEIGWCVLNEDGKVQSLHEKPLLGVHFFDHGEDTSLLEKMEECSFLEDLFSPEIAAFDPTFFNRFSRKRSFQKGKDLYREMILKKYPTPYHLIDFLLKTEEMPNLRLFYLGIESFFKIATKPSVLEGASFEFLIKKVEEEFKKVFQSKDMMSFELTDEKMKNLHQALLTKKLSRLLNIGGEDLRDREPLVQIFRLIAGFEIYLSNAFANSWYLTEESVRRIKGMVYTDSFSFLQWNHKTEEERKALFFDFYPMMRAMKDLHDFIFLERIITEGSLISYNKERLHRIIEKEKESQKRKVPFKKEKKDYFFPVPASFYKKDLDLLLEKGEAWFPFLKEKNISNKIKDLFKKNPLKETNALLFSYERLGLLPFSLTEKRAIFQAGKICKKIRSFLKEDPKQISIHIQKSPGFFMPKEESSPVFHHTKKSLLACYEKLEGEENKSLKKALQEEKEPLSLLKILFYQQKGKCLYSLSDIPPQESNSSALFNIDHIYPRAKAAEEFGRENLALVRKRINEEKAAEYPIPGRFLHYRANVFWRKLKKEGFMTNKTYQLLEGRVYDIRKKRSPWKEDPFFPEEKMQDLFQKAFPKTALHQVPGNYLLEETFFDQSLPMKSKEGGLLKRALYAGGFFLSFPNNDSWKKDRNEGRLIEWMHPFSLEALPSKIPQKSYENPRNFKVAPFLSFEKRKPEHTFLKQKRVRIKKMPLPIYPSVFFFIEYGKSNKRKKRICHLPCLAGGKSRSKEKLISYVKKAFPYINPKIQIQEFQAGDLVEINFLPFLFSGKKRKQLYFLPAQKISQAEKFSSFMEKWEKETDLFLIKKKAVRLYHIAIKILREDPYSSIFQKEIAKLQKEASSFYRWEAVYQKEFLEKIRRFLFSRNPNDLAIYFLDHGDFQVKLSSSAESPYPFNLLHQDILGMYKKREWMVTKGEARSFEKK